MSNEYINNEVDKIVADKNMPEPQNLAMACAWVLGNLKGVNLKVLEVGAKSSLADYFVLASATNPVQASSMADEIIGQLKRKGLTCKSKEGSQGADWILLDYGNLIVHIFLESSRPVYNLDGLWTDAKSIVIPHSYYFSAPQDAGGKKTDKGYF